MRSSGLLSLRHCRRLVFLTSGHYAFHLPGSLRSPGITRLRRYYGTSDSCPSQSSRAGLLASCTGISNRSASNHLIAPSIAFSRYPSASTASGLPVLGFAIRVEARQSIRPNRVHLRCGPAIRLTMLPTPPHGDAVSFGYRTENVSLKRTSTSLSKYTCQRTLLWAAPIQPSRAEPPQR